MPRKKKAKPATRGERVQMRLCDCRLVDVRENEDWAREAAVIERAMVRVEKRERERCIALIASARDDTPYTAVSKVTISRVLCSIEDGEQP